MTFAVVTVSITFTPSPSVNSPSCCVCFASTPLHMSKGKKKEDECKTGKGEPCRRLVMSCFVTAITCPHSALLLCHLFYDIVMATKRQASEVSQLPFIMLKAMWCASYSAGRKRCGQHRRYANSKAPTLSCMQDISSLNPRMLSCGAPKNGVGSRDERFALAEKVRQERGMIPQPSDCWSSALPVQLP